MLRAKRVFITDMEDLVLDKAASSASRNLTPAEFDTITFLPFKWGDQVPFQITVNPPNVVIGSDLLYADPKILPVLFHTLQDIIQLNPLAGCFITFQRRTFSVDLILDAAQKHKLSCTILIYEDIFGTFS